MTRRPDPLLLERVNALDARLHNLKAAVKSGRVGVIEHECQRVERAFTTLREYVAERREGAP